MYRFEEDFFFVVFLEKLQKYTKMETKKGKGSEADWQ